MKQTQKPWHECSQALKRMLKFRSQKIKITIMKCFTYLTFHCHKHSYWYWMELKIKQGWIIRGL